MPFSLRALAALLIAAGTLAACDAGFDGTASDNQAPETELSVRSTDLTEDLGERRLISTVELAWSGTDPDGVVTAYEVRAYQSTAAPGPEEGWGRTTRRDSTILLPIPFGEVTANVAVEVRAVDNDDTVDPSPARTVFPIRNSDPALSISRTEVPADTTWPVLAFAFAASDPDGELNLSGIEIALNDTLGQTVVLPADATFATLVAADPSAAVTDAEIFTGRGFVSSGETLPGLVLDGDNEIYARAVDRAGATSQWRASREPGGDAVSFYVRRVTSNVLLVNDYRSQSGPTPLGNATVQLVRDALAQQGTTDYQEWDLSQTIQIPASPRFSEALPATAEPTLRRTLALWDRIAWVSNSATSAATGYNLPKAAGVMDLFFNEGGKLLVYVPITLPQGNDGGSSNAAIDVLPLRELISYPAGARALTAQSGTLLTAAGSVPGTTRALPALRAARFLYNAVLPYSVGPDDTSLYQMEFSLDTGAPWTGARTLASIRNDGRVALFTLPNNGSFEPATPGGGGIPEALAVLLDALDFSQ